MAQAQIIDGVALAAHLNNELRGKVKALATRWRAPRLAVVLVGDDYASRVYVQRKHKSCVAVGIDSVDVKLPIGTTQAELAAHIAKLNADTEVDGILVQLPLPEHLVAHDIIARIDIAKDVDGLHPLNQGLLPRGAAQHMPCTPRAVMQLLQHACGSLAGKTAAVIGRSLLVGQPLSCLLVRADATVINIHSKTPNPAPLTQQADIVIAAAGVPHLVTAAWIKRGAVVVDVGINRTDAGLVGDVDYRTVHEVAAHITPVPGGVGPMTVSMLLHNTYDAAQRKA